jgi:hypothetical protein
LWTTFKRMTGAPRRLAFGLTHRFCGRGQYLILQLAVLLF